MMPKLCIALAVAISLVTEGSLAARQPSTEGPAFKRTNVELLNTSGKPQLVEFYHPT